MKKYYVSLGKQYHLFIDGICRLSIGYSTISEYNIGIEAFSKDGLLEITEKEFNEQLYIRIDYFKSIL